MKNNDLAQKNLMEIELSNDKKLTAFDNLYYKLLNEYESFINNLKKLPAEDIIEKSYEKVFKEDILVCFEVDEIISEAAALSLLERELPLDDLYKHWLSIDESYIDRLIESIYIFCNTL